MKGISSTYFKSMASRYKKIEITFYLELSIKTLFSIFMSCKEFFIENVCQNIRISISNVGGLSLPRVTSRKGT